MSISFPPIATSILRTPLRRSAARLLNPASQRPTVVFVGFDWAGDYGAGAGNPDVNVLVAMPNDNPNQPNAIDIIRSVKIDNTGNAFPVYVYFLDTTDTIVAPPDTMVWEPVVTNSTQANVILRGATNANNVGMTKVYFCNFFVPPYINAEIAQAVDLRLASPQIVSGGLFVQSGAVLTSGQSYTSNALAITGGGGGGAAAVHGVLDTFGRFTGVVVDNPGANYKSAVILTPTGANPARAAWTETNVQYNTGDIATYLGTEWARTGAAVFGGAAWAIFTYPTNSSVSFGGNGYLRTGGQMPPNGGVPGAWSANTTYATGDGALYGGNGYYRTGAAVVGEGHYPAWNGGTFYSGGDRVSSGGNNFQANFGNSGQAPFIGSSIWAYLPNSAPPSDGGWTLVQSPPNDPGWTISSRPPNAGGWLNSGTAGGSAASFNVTMAAGAGDLIQNPTYAPPALGDQISSYYDVVVGGGTFENNLFGSAYNGGFIYLTAINVVFSSGTPGGPYQWTLTNGSGIVLFSMTANVLTAAQAPFTVLRLNGLNLKLDALQVWQLVATTVPAGFSVAHHFAWTYSLK